MNAWLGLLCALFLVVGAPARASEAEPFARAWEGAVASASTPPVAEERTWFDPIDDFFGDWLVAPLAKVMFFDVFFWDDALSPGDGVGRVTAGAGFVLEVSRYDASQGYGTQRGYVVPSALPLPPSPVGVRFDPVDGQVEVMRTEGRPLLMARIPAQAADLGALGLTAWDPESGEQPVVTVNLEGLPFPVSVNRRTGQIEPTEGIAPRDAVPLTPGMRVWAEVPTWDASGTQTTRAAELVVRAVTPAGVQVLEPEVDWDPKPLKNPEQASMPAVVLWLVLGAIFFTLRMAFINLRGFGHAIAVVAGRYEDPGSAGEITHFQALSSALSATVGLGNIAGVAIAISLGGPGAVFWMWVAGFLGMSSKFTECTLGQMYRVTKPDGTVSGGPMHYLDRGLAELGLGPLGKVLAIVFAVMCIGGSFGGGNMFQANQSFEAVAEVVPSLKGAPWLYGLVLMTAVGLVIVGGIKRIGAAAGIVVPLMCGGYVLAGLYILATHAADVPGAFLHIVTEAFTPEAGMGGMVGVLAIGFQRASFSNEAGVGSASIAHSAATTGHPIREGIVALLEPFIDTIVVCSVTALVVVVTGVDVPPGSGIKATMEAFATILPWFPPVLALAAMLFAFSTMVSWSYYGERCTVWLLGEAFRRPYQIAFVIAVFLGSVLKLENVLDFSDLMILGMAFPNILGAVLLSGKVKAELDRYMSELRSGQFESEG